MSYISMAPLIYLPLVLLLSHHAEGGPEPPSPGYFPGSTIPHTRFSRAFRTLWGPQHQTLLNDNTLTLWLDRHSGSGFKSQKLYRSGYFSTAVKLQPGYTAGVITSFYLSNAEDYPGHHDEIDIEFLGTIPGEAYTLQTNVYIRGSGDGNIIGREMKFHLWFDPTQDFHDYAILWSPTEIVFFVDDVPIRRYPRKSEVTFPTRPMWVYGSIWDASSWATDNGEYKADYRYQPFVGRYKNFKLHGCLASRPPTCRPATAFPQGSLDLDSQQRAAMDWVQMSYLYYNYCTDPSRDHALTPEC